MMETDKTRVWLRRVSLAAGVAFTAHAEYDLARTLGADPWIAAMLPVAVDAYVIAALRWFRAFDIFLSLSLMGAAQIAAHLLDAKVMTVNIPMVVVVSLLVPVSIWRTHALARIESGVPNGTPAVPVEPERNLYEELAAAQIARQYGVEVDRAPEVYPASPAPVLAAEVAPTRDAVHAEYVPDEDDDQADPDPLIAEARRDFPDGAGVGALKARYRIGQPRAQRIRDALAVQS